MPQSTRGRRLMGEINVVPYIDVMLVLLIIFMITAPLLTQGVKVELPDAAAAPLDDELLRRHEPLVVSVDRQGRYYVNVGGDEQQPVATEALSQRVATVLRRDPETPVLLKADQSVPYGRVVSAMVVLQEAGAKRVGFLTDPVKPRR